MARSNVPFAALAVASGVVLLYLGRSMTFDNDEWRSATFDGGVVDYLRPVNEHWSTFPLLLYRTTFALFELRSHLPYQFELVVLHLLAVTGEYALMRRRIGPLPAALVALPLLLLGAGAENLYWAFQTGFIGSVAFGLWALFFLERPGRAAALVATALLVAALASSGVGLFFVVVVFGRAIVDPSLRRRVVVVAAPAATYLLWFAVFGRHAVGVNGPIGFDPAAARFALRGIIYSAEHASGLDHLPNGHMWGLALLLLLAALTVVSYAGRGAHLAVACLLGLIAMYTVIASVRADLGREYGTESRYVYVSAFLLALAAVDLASGLGATQSRRGITTTVALVLCTGFVTWANVDDLIDKRSFFQFKSDVNRAFVGLALTRGSERWVDQHATVGYMPPAPELVGTVERHGSPLRDELLPAVATIPGKAAEEFALLAMVGDGFRVEPLPSQSGFTLSQTHVVRSAHIHSSGRCVNAAIADEVWVTRVPSAAHIRIRSSTAPAVRVDLAHEGWRPRPIHAALKPSAWMDVVLPDVGDSRPWVVGFVSEGSVATVDLCLYRRAPRTTRSHGSHRPSVTDVSSGSPTPKLGSIRG